MSWGESALQFHICPVDGFHLSRRVNIYSTDMSHPCNEDNQVRKNTHQRDRNLIQTVHLHYLTHSQNTGYISNCLRFFFQSSSLNHPNKSRAVCTKHSDHCLFNTATSLTVKSKVTHASELWCSLFVATNCDSVSFLWRQLPVTYSTASAWLRPFHFPLFYLTSLTYSKQESK